jgi:amino acid adenylation domain-containing protein
VQEQIIQGYRLSPQQDRLWSLGQACGSLPFRTQCAVLAEGALDDAALTVAVADVVDRHQILRTTFQYLLGTTLPVQVIRDAELTFGAEYDFRHLSQPDQRRRVEEIIREAWQSHLDCEQGPLVHCSLLHLSRLTRMLIITLPALSSDSMGVKNIVREISRSYAAVVGQTQRFDDPMQYIVASEWQNELFDSEDFEVGRIFWSDYDLSKLGASILPLGRQYDSELSFEPQSFSIEIRDSEETAPKQVARTYGVPLSAVYLTCWHVLLGRLTGQSDIVVGTGFDGRSDEEIETALGLFAKYLPVSSCMYDGLIFSELLGKIEASVRTVRDWQEWFTWNSLAGVAPDKVNTIFFPLCFDYEEAAECYTASDVTFTIYRYYACIDRFELKLRCRRVKTGVTLEFHYNSSLFDAAEIERLAKQYQRLLESAAGTPEGAIGDLDLLTKEDRRQLFSDLNYRLKPHGADKGIPETFEQQVERTPDSGAVVYDDETLTYRELNKRANQVAHYLSKEGAETEGLVPICVDRSVEMIVGVLGILKAGAAYVPIDPGTPAERFAFMLRDSGAAVLVSQQKFAAGLTDQRVKKICLDRDRDDISRESEENPTNFVSRHNLAYMIYTSGSTGNPKGVMVEHQSPLNLLASLIQAIYVNQRGSPLVVSLNAPLAFDASVQQIMSLMLGHTMQIIPQEIRADRRAFLAYLAVNQVDILDCTPSHLESLLEVDFPSSENRTPRSILVAGEAIGDRLWKRLSQTIEPVIYNLYGPTECTVDATCCRVDRSMPKPTIGWPLENYRLYILDTQSRLAPLAASGELYIGGVGLARGYLNQPELTAQKFIPDPFSPLPGARLYKTGDLGRFVWDGRIEFLGRLDSQVKVRGYRIELGEIETVLARHPGVRTCAVCVREDQPGDKRVVAFIVQSAENPPATGDLQEYLQAHLPRYMVPSEFVRVLRLPLTPSGKLDRKALERLETPVIEVALPPRDVTELYLFHVWSGVLQTENFGIRDNFFDVGGHSLTAVTLSSRLEKTYREKISVKTVFDYPTVEQMAGYLRREIAFVPPSALVPIQPKGTRRHFFCVPGAGGLAHLFLPLARHLGQDQPFYGFQSFELDLDRIPDLTVEDVARRYVTDLRRIQPEGPFQIGGYSSGAVVAYEMAQQLHAAGQQVSVLAVLDGSLPSSPVENKPLSEQEFQVQLHEVAVWYSTVWLGLTVSDASSMSTHDLVQLNVSRQKQNLEGLEVSTGQMDLTEIHYLWLFRNMVTNTHASARYRPKPYPARVTLFRGKNDREHTYGWNQWALGGVEVFYFDAGHLHFIRDPNAAALASQLANCFAQADYVSVVPSKQSDKCPSNT